MDNITDPLERYTREDGRRETPRGNQAFRDYALLGGGRSLEKLLAKYTNLTTDSHQIPLTKSIDTLKTWSRSFSWVERVTRFDEIQQANAKAAYEEHWRSQIMSGDEVLGRLSQEARTNISEFIKKRIDPVLDKDGNPTGAIVETFGINWEVVKEKGHLIKSITSTANGPRIELYDGQSAKVQLGKYHKLFVDRQDVSGTIKHENDPHDAERFDLAISKLADALRDVLPGAGTGPEGEVDAAEQAPMAGPALTSG